MKELTKFQTILYNLGGVLMLIGALLPMEPSLITYAAYTYTCGAVAFGCMQLLQRYEGRNPALIRLRRQQIIGALLLIASGILSLMGHLQPAWVQGDEWLFLLTMGAVLEVYSAFRIPAALAKAEKK